MKNKGEAIKEYGKSLLNFSVAILVFAILNPILTNEVNLYKLLIFAGVYLIVVVLGVLFISYGGSDNETGS